MQGRVDSNGVAYFSTIVGFVGIGVLDAVVLVDVGVAFRGCWGGGYGTERDE